MKKLCLPMIMLFSVCIFLGILQAEVMAGNHTDYFSDNYQAAREKFIKEAKNVGASLGSFQNPLKGPHGESLFTDVAIVGSKHATEFIVLESGTHGVEGFAGSAIQTGLLRERIHTDLGPHMGLIMIHAINPYGFAHIRRFNEDNVDLNRNFIDRTKPYPRNEGYEELADVIQPESLSTWSGIKLRVKILLYRLKHGKAEMKRALSGGQYSHPKGIFFGGRHETWSNRTLQTIIKKYLSNAQKVTFIDFHTGLGSFGAAEIIMNVDPDSPEYKRAVQIWGNLVKTTVSGDSVSAHLYGTLKLAVPKLIPQAEVTAVSLEFGTYPAKDVFLALRAENWLLYHGSKNHPKELEIKSELLRVFYPNTDDWNQMIWNHGREIVEKVLVKHPGPEGQALGCPSKGLATQS